MIVKEKLRKDDIQIADKAARMAERNLTKETIHKSEWTTDDFQLTEDMGHLAWKPREFVEYAFPWGEGRLKDRTLEPWQAEFLDDIGRQVRENRFDGTKSVKAVREAVSSGHGIGKSAMTSWLILWLMSTRPNAKGTVTANTMRQLKTKTWAELGKWFKLCITGYWFDLTATALVNKQHPDDWRCDLQTSDESNSEAFAGQHAIDSSSFYIFDEASAIGSGIWVVAKGGGTDGEPFHFAFGNPTKTTGGFADCFGKNRHRWGHRKIDSRLVSFTNKDEIQEIIDDYGIDHDITRVRVLGEFPRASSLQFIDSETVEKAAARELKPEVYKYASVVLGVDVAWEGDDKHVIVKRQGKASWILGEWRHLPNETATLIKLVAQFEDEHQADAVFVDMHGIGGGVIDGLRDLNREPIPVNSRLTPTNPNQHGSKRTEMWWAMREWLYSEASIPDHEVLRRELTSPEYLPVGDDGKVILEPKKLMKKRGIESPDIADALAYTFYQPVSRRPYRLGSVLVDRDALDELTRRKEADTEYDVLEY